MSKKENHFQIFLIGFFLLFLISLSIFGALRIIDTFVNSSNKTNKKELKSEIQQEIKTPSKKQVDPFIVPAPDLE